MDPVYETVLNIISSYATIPILLLVIGATYLIKACAELIISWKCQRDADARLQKEAQDGTIILLSCEQYMALHDADPNRYPLTEEAAWAIYYEKKNTNIRMLHKDFDLLEKYIEAEKQEKRSRQAEKEIVTKRASCIEELTKMRGILSSRIDELEVQNREAATAVVTNSINALKAEQGDSVNGIMVSSDAGSLGMH